MILNKESVEVEYWVYQHILGGFDADDVESKLPSLESHERWISVMLQEFQYETRVASQLEQFKAWPWDGENIKLGEHHTLHELSSISPDKV